MKNQKLTININAAFPAALHAKMKLAALKAGLTLKAWLIQTADKETK